MDLVYTQRMEDCLSLVDERDYPMILSVYCENACDYFETIHICQCSEYELKNYSICDQNNKKKWFDFDVIRCDLSFPLSTSFKMQKVKSLKKNLSSNTLTAVWYFKLISIVAFIIPSSRKMLCYISRIHKPKGVMQRR